MRPAFTACFDSVALSAATAKTVVGIKAAPNHIAVITAVAVTFHGVTSSDIPVLIEVVSGTDASNSPGTNSTTITPPQLRGRVLTCDAAAAHTWTSEPTVLTRIWELRVSPTSGVVIQLPLGREIECDPTTNKLIGVRMTAPAAVSVSGTLEFEE